MLVCKEMVEGKSVFSREILLRKSVESYRSQWPINARIKTNTEQVTILVVASACRPTKNKICVKCALSEKVQL